MRTLTLACTLRDGTTHTWHVAKRPRYIGSWMMQQLPYGTNFHGATFACTQAS